MRLSPLALLSHAAFGAGVVPAPAADKPDAAPVKTALERTRRARASSW